MTVFDALLSGTADQIPLSARPQASAHRGFLSLPYELRAPIYRYLLEGQMAIQKPGTPPTDAFTALKRRVPCLTPRTPGKRRFGCSVHDNGLQVLRLCKFIRDDVMEILRSSRCDILINEHGIFRSYRIPPQDQARVQVDQDGARGRRT